MRKVLIGVELHMEKSKYPPVKPVALNCEPLKAVC
jgi:hypothetical protein